MVMKPALLFFALNLIDNSHSWIFNNIDYKLLENNILDDKNRDIGNELSAEDLMNLRFNLIYPGTKWCGPGNIADDYDDLGTSQEADICCRDHDNCPDTIPAGETKHNLTNEAYYTKLSCDCDEKFRQCLRSGNTKSTTTVGLMYFNIIGTQCFRSDYLVTGCVKQGGWLNTKCVEYSYDTTSEMTYQWFDVPNYEY
ncbi:phospholipase A2-like [Vanessa tameamea]|uniref:Phospholipase A2 n=1 Tax=Vanessa tameamea TaxID=334116 RepID=A0A8B8HUM0_VANTA|nr:phospholipase A2-like [Vanessa tameamea]